VTGSLAFVLHAHLPFVRHPAHDDFLEERWLFEVVVGCHVPLLWVLEGWERDGVPGGWTMSISPTLAAMLSDPLMRSRVGRHLERWERLARNEEERQTLQPAWQRVASFHRQRLARVRQTWEAIGGDLLGAWRAWERAGRIHLMTCGATHALLPLLSELPWAMRAQVDTAAREHRRHFGCPPRGFWLPECAYAPAVEPALRGAGIEWTVLETHGLLGAHPAPARGVLAPIRTPGGLTCFGRDPSSARQVWSRDVGYPGDPRYREFHRDVADDAEWSYVEPHAAGTGRRVPTGLKMHRVTGASGEKQPYDPDAALAAVGEHARHFVEARLRWLAGRADRGEPVGHGIPTSPAPLIVAPYDAELFGHWWMEGPAFIDAVAREARLRGLGLVSLADHPAWSRGAHVARPAASSWGEGGHLGVWLDASNAWMQRPLRSMNLRLARWLDAARQSGPAGGRAGDAAAMTRDRCLRQAAREWMLAWASDWPFLIRMNTARAYAEARFRSHVGRFDRLEAMAHGREGIDPSWLGMVEAEDNLFPEIDPASWLGRDEPVQGVGRPPHA